MDIFDTIRPDTTYSNNLITITTFHSDHEDPFMRDPVCERGRDVALAITGHRSWDADTNLTHHGHQEDRGEKLAREYFAKAYGSPAVDAIPIYLFQHGQVALQRRQTCHWDSGFLGWMLLGESKSDDVIDSYIKSWTAFYNNEAYGYTLEREQSISIDGLVFRNEALSLGSFEGGFDDCGLVEYLKEEHFTEMRILGDDETLSPREIVKTFGRTFLRSISSLDTKLGNKAKEYFAKEV